MKIRFDSRVLSKQLQVIRAALPTSKSTIEGENVIALGAKDGTLIAFASVKGFWTRVVTPCEVLEAGVIQVDRTRFFALLAVLNDTVIFNKTASSTQVKIKTEKSSGSYTLTASNADQPRPKIPAEIQARTVDVSVLKDQLHLSVLDGELVGGGYSVKCDGHWLTVMATDKQRLVVTKQQMSQELDLSIHPLAMKGTFEILKVTKDTVDIKTSSNLTSISTSLEDGTSIEFGFNNSVEVFPAVAKLLSAHNFPNHARFEVGDLVDAFAKAQALAENELPFADFDFSSAEVCKLESFNADGSAEIGLDCPSDIEDELTCILRLQLPHLKSLLNKAKAFGATWVHCNWGTKLPVKWSFDFEGAEESKYSDIEMIYITAAMNRNATVN